MRRVRVALALVGTAVLAAACGSTSTAKTTRPAASSTGATSTTMGSSSTSMGGSSTTMGSSSTSMGSTAASASALVRTGEATVGGMKETVLVDAAGRTLYYRTTDTATSVCSGSCAAIWPPLLDHGTGAVAGFGGKLGVLTDANGRQLTYDGHPLYTYSGDTAAGQAHGQGILNVWYVATPGLAAASGTSTSTTSTTSSGYGY